MRYRIMCPAPLFGHSRFLPSVSTTQPLKSPTYSSNIFEQHKENPVIEAVAEKSHEQSPCPIDPGLTIAILEKRVRLVQVLPAILETPLLILISKCSHNLKLVPQASSTGSKSGSIPGP